MLKTPKTKPPPSGVPESGDPVMSAKRNISVSTHAPARGATKSLHDTAVSSMPLRSFQPGRHRLFVFYSLSFITAALSSDVLGYFKPLDAASERGMTG